MARGGNNLPEARAARWAKPGARERMSEMSREFWRTSPHREKVLRAIRSPEARRKAANALRVPLGLRLLKRSQGCGECIVWIGAKDKRGYAQMRLEKRTRYVTHIILELKGEDRPSAKHCALHSCDNPACIHPDHLRWGTQKENIQDAIDRGRLNMTGLELGRGRK